jgi:hypothetical protein
MKNHKDPEVWCQDTDNADLWHGQHGVIVNTAALAEREFYYHVIRIKPHRTFRDLLRDFAIAQRLNGYA